MYATQTDRHTVSVWYCDAHFIRPKIETKGCMTRNFTFRLSKCVLIRWNQSTMTMKKAKLKRTFRVGTVCIC